MNDRPGGRSARATVLIVAIALAPSACGSAGTGGLSGTGGPAATLASGAVVESPTPAATSAVPATSSPRPSPPVADDGAWPRPRWCQPEGTGQPSHDDVLLPILYYHRSQDPPADFWSWPQAKRDDFITYDTLPAALSLQLDWLSTNGYTTILPADLAAHWAYGCPLPKRPVILTFDDGSPDWLTTVLPLLHAHGMAAEFYVTLQAIARRTISWSDLRTLAANGMGIGAHDVHHVQLAMLGGGHPAADAHTMWSEVNDARQMIGTRIGRMPDSMAYVGGGFDPTLIGLVDQSGYTTARSILHGVIQRWADRFTLRVVRVGPYDDVTDRHAWTVDPAVPRFADKVAGYAQ